ncbi:sensor histidine kinase [Haloarchaeobius litoreus]|uniref:histidine kinase n=1 Tax=Haloarchaeobius litoreus TaxID=755306 RepID=A0ABD6DG10_9EURY|nr:HAMP domain-containing sensor histidine kinase [Haloarchaeobius litoreus]
MTGVFDRHPSLPVVGLGVGYLVAAAVHLVGGGNDGVATAVEAVLLGLLGTALLYGSVRLSRLDLDTHDGLRVFFWVLGSGLVGLVVATLLIKMQQLEGVELQNIPVLLVTASGATAIVGLGVAEYRERLWSERKTLREQTDYTARLHRRLSVLNRALRHNLRNETTVIRGYTESLLDTEPRDDSRATLRTIRKHTKNVERLGNQAKRLNQVWENEFTDELDLTEVVEVSVEDVLAEHDDVTVTTDLPPSAPADVHHRFDFAVREAVENAVRHNDPGTDVRVSIDRNPPDTVTVSVSDTGDGIPEDELDAIREGSEDSLVHGSGLGLWLMYWTVTMSNGDLSFERNEPQGTVVEMTVPATEAN